MKKVLILITCLLTLSSIPGRASSVGNIVNLAIDESYVLNTALKIKRVQISSPDVATVKVLDTNEIMLTGKGVGETELRIWNKDKIEKHFVVRVGVKALATKQVAEIIKRIAPDGKVHFTLSPQQLLLTGTVPTASRGERLQKILTSLDYKVVNLITVTGQQQVQLFVRVAEVIKGNPMRAGIALQNKRDQVGLFPPGNLGTGADFLINVDKIVSGVVSSANAGVKRGLAFPHTNAFQIGFNPTGTDFYGVLSIMEGHDLARVLAQPTLVVESGKSASFLAGGEVPIPVAQQQNTITVEWKKYGIILDFSPVILENGLISISLKQEVSSVDWTNGITLGNVVMPGFKTRNTNTTIKVHNGESFVVSGLLHDEIRSTVNKVPLLGDIPVLGALFRSSSYDKQQSELAVVVTAKIVSPIARGTKITMPGENMTNPGFWPAFLFGRQIASRNPGTVTNLLQNVGLETP